MTTLTSTAMPTLNSLPNEILGLIASAICRERQTDPRIISCNAISDCPPDGHHDHPDTGHGFPCDRQRLRALRSLCLTSRRFHAVALPHLYHHVEVADWSLLARTLAARPDLAAHTRALHFPGVSQPAHEEVMSDRHLRAAFLRRRRAYSIYACVNFFDDHYLDEMAEVSLDNLFQGEANLTLALLTSLLPNLETLHAVISYGPVFRFCTPGSLPRLRHVRLDYPAYSLDGFWVRMDLAMVVPLFCAARDNLETIFLESCDFVAPLMAWERRAQRQRQLQQRLEEKGLYEGGEDSEMDDDVEVEEDEGDDHLSFVDPTLWDKFGNLDIDEVRTLLLERAPQLQSFALDFPPYQEWLDEEEEKAQKLERDLEARGVKCDIGILAGSDLDFSGSDWDPSDSERTRG
ncbi:hypothetical protein VTJ49DRAFT_740 [Mycothermus thermophilus]|uniref:F-box domain-containing protein n=1 Tax=Humicola insolens TaxID=85995 RepID=A0ABR3VGC4_HUMIN